MRIDNSGNLLVGKTALDNSTVGIRMNSTGDASFVKDGSRALVLNRKTSDGDIALFLKDGTTVGSIGTAATDIYIGTTDTGIRFNDAVNGVLPYNTSSGQTDNTIDLGFSSVRWKDLHLAGTANVANVTSTSQIKVTGSNASTVAYSVGDTNTGLFNTGSNSIGVSTNGSERMRIDSSGNALVGKTSTSGSTVGWSFNSTGLVTQVFDLAGGNEALIMNNTNASESTYTIDLRQAGTDSGRIRVTASAVEYQTSSDYRLKENVDYNWDATTRLKQLKPARFNWIKDDTDTLIDGFLAHEVSDIVPESISGEKDELYPQGHEKAGEPRYQGIDQSKLVPLLVKTVQELEARIEALENA